MKIKVLLIEDNPGDANLIGLYLKEASIKHEFFHTETLYEGVEISESHGIDIALLDLRLPDASGLRTLSKFQERLPDIPVIVLTGLDDDDVGESAIKSGAQDYLVKGRKLNGHVLGRSIRFALERWQQQTNVQDINDQLKKSEQKWTITSEMAKIGNWEIDIVTNEMNWTEEVYRIFELPMNSVSPSFTFFKDYIFIEDRELVESTIEEATKDGQSHSIRYRIKVGGNRIKHVENHFKIYLNEISERTFLIGAIQDVTEQVKAQEIIKDEAYRNRTSKIKEGMLEILGFNIRTPLASVLNFSHLMQDELGNSADMENLMHSINDLSVAVNNLLNFSMLSTEKIKLENSNFNIQDLCQRINQFFQIKASEKSVKLEIFANVDVPDMLHGDEQKIQQIMYNLIDNAIKFSPEGGNVSLVVENISKNDEKKFLFKVSDQGQGILPERISELLEADQLLASVNDEDEQKGFGLAIVTKLAKSMEGKFDIQSALGKGSVFSVQLPIEVAEVSQIRLGEKPMAAYNFLLVEDHFLNQIATKKMIQNWAEFSTVDIAENGKIGLEKSQAKQYDLILMDLQMPVMGGLEAARKIREKDPDTPILALSANTSKSEAENSIESGMDDYLAKPYKREDLFGKMINLLNRGRVKSGPSEGQPLPSR